MIYSSETQYISLRFLPALHGDAMHIVFSGEDNLEHHIFIDGGFESTYRQTLKKEVEPIKRSGGKIDLFIVTHTDHDHIGGVINFIKDPENDGLVNQFLFNQSVVNFVPKADENEISITDGIELRNYLNKKGLLSFPIITNDMNELGLYGAHLKILSPRKTTLENFQILREKQEQNIVKSEDILAVQNDHFLDVEELSLKPFQEDKKLENMVSIALIFEYKGKSILFLADSHPSIIVKSLNELGYSDKRRLRVDLVQLSHHGSKFNTSYELLSIIDCHKFVVSANGKNRFNFPHKEPMARIIKNPCRDLTKEVIFYFNYDNDVLRRIFSERELLIYNLSCVYPKGNGNVLTIDL